MKNNENADIFVCAHKEFKVCPTNPVYKVIHGDSDLNVPIEQYRETDTDLHSMEFSLAEGSRIYWLWKNWKCKDYIGICHYRKYFKFFNEVPDLDEVFNEYDVITTEMTLPFDMPTAYKITHRFEDFKTVFRIVSEKYEWISNSLLNSGTCNKLHPCNMFVMRREDFNEYCGIVFDIINIFCERMNWKSDDDIKKFVAEHESEYKKSIYPGNTLEYQSRVLGFILERLTSMYIDAKFKSPLISEIIVTEDKYTKISETYEI